MPVEALETISQQIVFELVKTACEGTVEVMVPSIKVKGVDGDGRWNGGDVDVDGTMSGVGTVLSLGAYLGLVVLILDSYLSLCRLVLAY